MRKVNLLAVFLMLALSLGLAAPASAQRGRAAGSFRFAKRPLKERNRRLKYTIDASYPQLVGAGAANAAQFNLAVKQVLLEEVNGFKKDFVAPDSSMPREMQESSFDAGYTIDYGGPDLISVSFGISAYSAGAAHPNHYSTVFNYDLQAGRTLSLSDLFKPRSNYLQAISRYAVSALKKELGPDPDNDWIERGAGPSSENFKSWTITRRGLTLIFDPYQVASYAEGSHVVNIPYSALRNVINTDGPLGPLVSKGR